MSSSKVFQLEEYRTEVIDGTRSYVGSGIEWLNQDIIKKDSFPSSDFIESFDESGNYIEDDFDCLVKALPGCFKFDKEKLSVTLVEKPTQYVNNYINKIKKMADGLGCNNLTVMYSVYRLENVINENDCKFMIYSKKDGYLIPMHQWITRLFALGEVGTTFYLGGVVDYHYTPTIAEYHY